MQEATAEERAVEARQVVRGRHDRAGGPREGLPDHADVERAASAVVAGVAMRVASGDPRLGIEAGGAKMQGHEDPPSHFAGQWVSARGFGHQAEGDVAGEY